MSKGYSIQQKGGRWYVVFAFQGKQIWRTTHMADEAAADRVAPAIREAYIAQAYRDMINPPAPVVAPAKFATIAEIVAAYRAANKRCNGDTEARAIARFLAIVREMTGCAKGDEGKQSSTILTRANAEAWQARRQGISSAEPDLSTRRRSNVTINSTFRQARDVFAARYRSSAGFRELTLPPDLEGWLSTPALPVPREGWKPWPLEAYARMRAAGDAIQDEELWIAHQLLRRLGLRTGELKAATREWVVPMVGGGWGLDVRDYAGGDAPHPFQIKGAQARVLPLPHDLAARLLDRTGYLVRGDRDYKLFRGKTQITMKLIDEVHADWLRQFCPPSVRKPNHELRKWVGALIYTTQGAEAARRFLGHSDAKTLEQHYADYLRLVEVDEQWKELEVV